LGFGYFGELGPSLWGTLDPAWGVCASGEIQAPVDLGRNQTTSHRFHTLSIDYGPTTGEIFNNGHTIEIETEGENLLTIEGVEYELVQFHFHGPSEHTLEGEGTDMELHLVHRNAAGTNAVVAVLLDRGATSGALSPILGQLPDDLTVHHPLDAPFDPADFLPEARVHARYLGSLTTPPCTEGVQWFVLMTPMTVSTEHLAQFHERIHFNARPVQRSLP
jgi:carbonic anhydrase